MESQGCGPLSKKQRIRNTELIEGQQGYYGLKDRAHGIHIPRHCRIVSKPRNTLRSTMDGEDAKTRNRSTEAL